MKRPVRLQTISFWTEMAFVWSLALFFWWAAFGQPFRQVRTALSAQSNDLAVLRAELTGKLAVLESKLPPPSPPPTPEKPEGRKYTRPLWGRR